MRPTVAVVIPARDAAATLPACLEAVFASEPAPVAVVLADDASTDPTAEIAAAAGCTVVSTGDRAVGPAAARNFAVAAAPPADFVAFVDADVVVRPETLGRLVDTVLADDDAVAAFGSYDDDPPERNVASLYMNLRHHHVHRHAGPTAETFWAGCGVVRRDVFEAVGGFDASYAKPSIEDVELGARLRDRGTIRIVPEALCTHLKRWTVTGVWKTDVLRRALPWSWLIARRTGLAVGLNVDNRNRLSAVAAHLVWFAWLCVPLIGPRAWLSSAAAAAIWMSLNSGFLALLFRRGGFAAGLGGTLLHWLHHQYASVTFAAVAVASRWRGHGRIATTILVVAISGLSAAGAAGIVVNQTWRPEFGGYRGADRAEVRLMGGLRADAARTRFVELAVAYLAVAVTLTLVGPKPLDVVVRDGRRYASRLRLGPCGADSAVVAAATVGGMALWACYVSQPIRMDEATTTLFFGSRSPLHAVTSYKSTNNHIAHSVTLIPTLAVFGDAEWAVRLPAFVTTAACVPAAYFAGVRMFGRPVGLIAAAVFPFTALGVETATNARGYPLMMLMTLVGYGLLPSVSRGRPAAVTAFAAASALGAWAVPTMLHAFAGSASWLLGRAYRSPFGFDRRRFVAAAAAVTLTGLFTVALYSPAYPLSGLGSSGTGRAVTKIQDSDVGDRLVEANRNLRYAAERWVFPHPAGVAAVVVAGGLMAACVAPRRRTPLFAASVVAGPLVTFVLTRFSALPWWSLCLWYPATTLLAAAAIWEVVRRLPAVTPRRAAVATAAGLVIGFPYAGYPDRYPGHVGFPEAREVIADLAARDIPYRRVYAGIVLEMPMRYYAGRLGYEMDNIYPPPWSPAKVWDRFYVVTRSRKRPGWLPTTLRRPEFRVVGERRFGAATIFEFVNDAFVPPETEPADDR